MSDTDTKFEIQLKRRLSESVEAIDAATLSRVNQIRTDALESLNYCKARDIALWLPAGVIASICLSLLLTGIAPETMDEKETFIDEIDIITDLELYENLEFYEWLEQHELPS